MDSVASVRRLTVKCEQEHLRLRFECAVYAVW